MNSNPSETNRDLQNLNLVDSASSNNQENNSTTRNEIESSSNDAIDSNAIDSREGEVAEAPTKAHRRSSRLSSKKRIVFTEIDSDVDEEEEEEQVVSTKPPRKKKKRSGKKSDDQDESDDYVLQDNKGKKPDAKHEASPPSKPSKILYLEPTDYKIDFDLLCGGIIQNIFSYIPSTRGLFSLSQMSKRLRSLLTYEHIVRVVVLSDKKEKIKDLENLISSCTEARFIYTPSVQRLLRMMVSNKCELGDECWAYNMEEENPGRVSNNPYHGYQCGLHVSNMSLKRFLLNDKTTTNHHTLSLLSHLNVLFIMPP